MNRDESARGKTVPVAGATSAHRPSAS